MPFERSQEIERRLDEEVGVSIPTISRCVTALRERGHDIESKRTSDGWRYVIVDKPKRKQAAAMPHDDGH